MTLDRWFDSAEDRLVADLNAGLISQRDFNDEMRELQRDFEASVQEEAQAAHDDVLDSYGWRR